MRVSVLLLVGFIAAAQGRSLLASDGQPDTPPYEVKNSTKALEVREYANATWVVAFGRSRWAIDFAAHSAGLALAGYFKGGNVDHTALQPTVPLVATILRPPHPPHHKNGSHPEPPHHKNKTHSGPPHHKPHPPPGPPAVALAAYIPEKYQGNAPIPDSPRVKIVDTNSTEVYVHKFGGWAISWVVRHEIKHAALALKDVGICPRKGKFFVATYNGPFKVFGRHNEILWVKKPKHSHHNNTLAEESTDLLGKGASQGWEVFDVESLFPEEFPVPPKVDKQPTDLTPEEHVEKLDRNKAEISPVVFDGADSDAIQTS